MYSIVGCKNKFVNLISSMLRTFPVVV